ncbi:triose-phosphate transporter family protein [Nitzschia inconspicua]|uniref:Triose-phosphate transporter family protein n=1 Tax=Nitzschia inconspicua TaxID=303405 RepID=A0A9K3PR30_9STRA|nr:triose-phosphate transporter family protein [Nitzschia inconspicua]
MTLTRQKEIILAILAYSFCSGTLVLLNKLTLHFLPFPSLVVSFQLFACIVIIYSMQAFGYVDVDSIQWSNVKPYMLYIFFFATGVYCNMRSLSTSNVETVIVFRALSPSIVAFLDALCLGREWPSQRSWLGLLTLVMGAYGYASFDEKFQTQGMSAYFWPVCYTVVIALEMAYGKQIVKSVPLKTKSGPVIYTNLLGIIPMLLLANVGNEYSKFWDFYWSGSTNARLPPMSIFLLIIGSLVGTGIGYSSWWCREMVSATSFTLIGVINKCLTILLNLLIWDQHAKPGGIFCLFVCIAGGMIYQQAPMRSDRKVIETGITADDEEFESEIHPNVHSKDDEEMQDLLSDKNARKRG